MTTARTATVTAAAGVGERRLAPKLSPSPTPTKPTVVAAVIDVLTVVVMVVVMVVVVVVAVDGDDGGAIYISPYANQTMDEGVG